MPTKTCSKCNVERPLESFGTVKQGQRSYPRRVCKPCMNAAQRATLPLPFDDGPVDIDLSDLDPVAPDCRPTAPEPGVPRGMPGHDPIPDLFFPIPDLFFRNHYAPPVPQETGLERILFIPDVHRPYHDKAAWALMLRAAKVFQPDKIVILGDFADFYSVSSFDKHPKRVSDLKTEAEDANVGLDELDALGARYKVFIKGNHEDRLERYLCKSAPALFGCVSVDDLFHLAERGWHVVDYKRSTRLGKLRLTHDTGTAGMNAHRQSVDAFQGPCVIGHTHRMEMSFKGCADGSPTVGAMFGWLGDFDSIDYMQAVKARRDWVHGFGIGFQESTTGIVHLQPVPIIKGTCVVAGVLVR